MSAAVFPGAAVAPTSERLWIDQQVPGSEWARFVDRHPDATCDHLWGWRDVFSAVFGQESVYLAARRGSDIVGVLPLVQFRSRLFGRAVISLPYLNYGGVLSTDDAATEALIAAAREVGSAFGATHVELRHRARQAPALPCRDHKVGMQLALPGSADALWSSLDRKVRNQVRKAQKEGLTAETGGRELVDEFYRVFTVNMRDLGTPVYAKQLFECTLETFPANARVHVIRKDGRPIAASVTVRFRDTVLVPWASSLREFRQHAPNMLLYWTMLEHCVSTGATCFDFGRSSRGGGTQHFKQQWGATETPLHWEYVLLTRHEAPSDGKESDSFSAAISLWQRLPLRVANMLGPAIVRHIP